MWPFRFVAVPVCGRSGLWPFRFVAVPVCGRSGLWPFRFVAVPVCGRSGLWPFRFVAVSAVAVSVCGRYDLLPAALGGEKLQARLNHNKHKGTVVPNSNWSNSCYPEFLALIRYCTSWRHLTMSFVNQILFVGLLLKMIWTYSAALMIFPVKMKISLLFQRNTSQWRHNDRDCVRNHRRLDYLPIYPVCPGADQRKHQSSVSLAIVYFAGK